MPKFVSNIIHIQFFFVFRIMKVNLRIFIICLVLVPLLKITSFREEKTKIDVAIVRLGLNFLILSV